MQLAVGPKPLDRCVGRLRPGIRLCGEVRFIDEVSVRVAQDFLWRRRQSLCPFRLHAFLLSAPLQRQVFWVALVEHEFGEVSQQMSGLEWPW